MSEIKLSKQKKAFFTATLLSWHYTVNFRSYPWKGVKDPYKIWLSEIILQQTRSDQGLPYYNNFIAKYPDIIALANAKDDDVFKLWQGLGYYNRCRNLLFTARYIRDHFDGEFPNDYETIVSLKGVGAYTAAAISSFAYDLPYAVLDGNVFRVLSRYVGISIPIDSVAGKREFATLAQELLAVDNPAGYNQAIMDFGASICTPKQAKCVECPLNVACTAYARDMVSLLPVKSKKIAVKNRYFHYVIISVKNTIYLELRDDSDIWANLYQPLLIEGDNVDVHKKLGEILGCRIDDKLNEVYETKQRLTHQLIYFKFYSLQLEEYPPSLNCNNFYDRTDLKALPFPKTIISFLDNKSYF